MMQAPFYDEAALATAVRGVLEAFHAEGYFPSASVRVFTADKTLFSHEVGGAREDTVYDVASLTKLATATQALQLVSQGKLRLEDGVLQRLPYLAEIRLLRERLSHVTVRMLLTHTSGIVDWYPFYAHCEMPFGEVLAIALQRYGPVTGMEYSDLNFMLLGMVLEEINGTALADCLAQNLVGPLALGRMTYKPDPAWEIAPSAYGNQIEESMCRDRGISFGGWRPHEPTRGEANDGNAYYYFGGVAGSAGIFADAMAYERFCRFHMTTGDPLLKCAQDEHAPTRGLGWQVSPMYPEGCGHTGFTGTSVYLSRRLGIGVVAFTNRLYMQTPKAEGFQAFRSALHRAVASQVLAAGSLSLRDGK